MRYEAVVFFSQAWPGALGLALRKALYPLLLGSCGRNVIFVGILDERLDDFNRKTFSLQIEGSKTSLELPGIVDEVLTLAEIKDEAGQPFRALVCHTLNPWGYPAKDRSGRLGLLEPPDLGRLFAKVTGAPLAPAAALPVAADPSVLPTI